MDKLFLRVYLNILAGILIAALAARLFVIPRVEAQLQRNVEASLSVPVALLAETYAERHATHGDFGGAAERAVRRFGVPAAVIPRGEVRLDAAALARLDRGAVVQTGPALQAVHFARIEGTDQVIRVGPLAAKLPVAGRRGLALFLLFVAGLSLGVFALLRPIRRQLADLRRTAEALGRGELGARATVASRDAIGSVATTLNHMGDEIQRLIAVRDELLHMTSHELRTPIQRMHFGLQRARDAPTDGDRARAHDVLERDLTELDRLIDELLTYVRLKEQQAPVPRPVELGPLLDDLCATLTEQAGDVVLAAPATPAALGVRAEPRLLRRAMSNLVVNALRHARARVTVTVTTAAGRVHIDVDDDPGIPAASRERIFAPFERLDDDDRGARRGFGLGLAIVRRIADGCGGTVAALDSPLGGARFRLSLPT